MADIARRFSQNPILTPTDIPPSVDSLEVVCLLNPGAFLFNGKIWLIIRVAERPPVKQGKICFPIRTSEGQLEICTIAENDPDLISDDPRVINYRRAGYLTTISHLRLMCSDDGNNFYEPEGYPQIHGLGQLETFGIEDCRVVEIDQQFWLTYTAVSECGVGVGLKTTYDWKNLKHHGMVMPPHNKDCAIFSEKIENTYYAIHRPSGLGIGGNYIWLAESPDGIHWGNHRCIVKTRSGYWDSERIGAGAAPIKTERGWLEIYHGADANNRYCLGAFLLDLHDPSIVISRTQHPIMEPTEPYELSGFFGQVVFTNGHILRPDGDTLTVYYGAADEFVCGADFSVSQILDLLE